MGIAKIHEGADPEKAADECVDRIMEMLEKDDAGRETVSGSGGENVDREKACGFCRENVSGSDGKSKGMEKTASSGKENAGKENASGSSRKERDKPTEQGDCAADRQAAGEEYKKPLSSARKTGAFRISIEHIAGAPAVSVSVVGKGGDVFNGIANLLEKTALIMTDGKVSEAATLVEMICGIVKANIFQEGDK